MVLVVLILFLFLQNWKATLVPGIAIPVALVGTFALVLGFGFSLNQLTLFGLVLATGLVVDDAITVIEDTSAKKAQGMSALQAAKSTMDELFSAVIATSLVKFAVFLPVLFFPGATGTIYKQFAATVIFRSRSQPSTPSRSHPCSLRCCWAGSRSRRVAAAMRLPAA